MLYQLNEKVHFFFNKEKKTLIFFSQNSLIQYWPDKDRPTIMFDDKYQIDFLHHTDHLHIRTSHFKLTNVRQTAMKISYSSFFFSLQINENQSHHLEHHQIQSWTEKTFSLDPISLLRLQYLVTPDEEQQNIVLHTL